MLDKRTKDKYIALAEFLHKTLGSEYEIILHDIDQETHSIAYLANGHISGRSIDDPETDQIFEFISSQTIAQNDYIISTKGVAKNNKIIRSSSLFIKDEQEQLVGILCINFNGSEYVNLAKKILRLTHMENASIENDRLHTFDFVENTHSSISEVAYDAFDSALDSYDIPIKRLTQEEKINVVRELNDKGVFLLKGAVGEVAKQLGVSEATLYRYIRTVTKEKPDT